MGAEYDGETLRRFFTLSPEDLEVVRSARGDHNRLGLALLLVWARSERKLVSDPATLPKPVIAHVLKQLGIETDGLEGYGARPATRSAHVATVCEHLGVRPFNASDECGLHEYLCTKAAHTGNTAALLDAAEDWLFREGVLRPTGETTGERLVYSARAAAEEELFAKVAKQLTEEQCERLDALCETGGGTSRVAYLSSPLHQPSAPAIRDACDRLTQVREALPEQIEWGTITQNRRRQWAAVVRRLYAQALRRYPEEKRHTLLLAFLSVRAQELTDAIVEMFDTLIGRVFSHTENDLTEARLKRAEAYAEGARLFRTLAQVLLDPEIPAEAVREEVFRRVGRDHIGSVFTASAGVAESEVEEFFALLDSRFRYVRSFVPLVLATLRFGSPRSGNELLEALEVLQTMKADGRLRLPVAPPVGFVPRRWAGAVSRPGGIDRHAWEFCLLFEARRALRAGDLTVEGSRRYTPWDTDLYAPDDWRARRPGWLTESGLPEEGNVYVARQIEELDRVTRDVSRRLPANADARVVKGKIALSALEKVELPQKAVDARRDLLALLPRVSLPELLMEVDRWTGYTSALTHLTGRRAPNPDRLSAMRPALFAVLVAEATNLGLSTMAHATGIPEGQLTRIYDWYFREETLRPAITSLIHYHRTLPLTAAFGSGTTSSSDGVRFGVAATALNARHNPRYFGVRRGLTVYSHVSDQSTQFWIDVVNCQMREATYVLDGLLYQDALPIREHYADTHGYTDLIFGLCEVLGYRFAPRLRDLPDQALYRARKDADYGALDPAFRQTVRSELIVAYWDDMLRLAASLKDGLVLPSLVVAKLQSLQRQNPLQQAIQELGRLAKTRHILSYVDDAQLRRRVLVGLNKQENLHSLARAIFFGRQGRFGDSGYEAQLNRASALSLVINAITVWNTRYLTAAAAELTRRGAPLPEGLWTHLSPLLWEHIHLVGQYRFDEPVIPEGLRPLRAPEDDRKGLESEL